MDVIRELLGRLQELSAEEMTQLIEAIDAEWDRIDAEPDSTEIVEATAAVVEAAETAQAEVARREEASAAATAQREELRNRMATARGNGEAEGEAGEGETGEAGEGEGDEGGEGAGTAAEGSEGQGTEGEQVPAGAGVQASGSGTAAPRVPARAARMSEHQRPAAGRNTPRQRFTAALVASVNRGNMRAGELIPDEEVLAEATAEQLRRMPRNTPGNGEGVVLASADWSDQWDRERFLIAGRDGENEAKLRRGSSPRSLQATGGICQPYAVDFSMPMWLTDERPLKAGLDSYGATRGGLTFRTAPDFGALSSATEVWTAATDASPGGSTKGVASVTCPTPESVIVDAIPTRLGFGNMMGQFDPETIAANTAAAMAWAAKVAELNLLAKIDAVSTAVSSENLLGAFRDALATLDLVVAAYRDRHRIPESQVVTAIFPIWAKYMFRADLTRELAHDNEVSTTFNLTDDQIDTLLMSRGVKAIWTLDGRAAKGSGITYPAQSFGAQSTGEINGWPSASGTALPQVVWNLFVEGSMTFLDGGRLDFGVVRDSTLNATNDYQTFVEPFEGLAFRGNEALTVISTWVPNGASAGTQNTGDYTGHGL